MTSIPEKLSFADVRKQQQNLKNNSDLTNLANALEKLDAKRRELKKSFDKAIAAIYELEGEINDLAAHIESGDVLDIGDVKTLYNRADKLANVYL